MNAAPNLLLTWLGHLHPMLVHLPIGFLVALAAIETLALLPRFRHAAAASEIILALAIPAAICSATCGWLLSLDDGYNSDLIFWHKWLGTALSPTIIVLFFLQRRPGKSLYRVALLLTMILLAVVGHLGGSITHGENFFFPWREQKHDHPASEETNLIASPEELLHGQPAYAAIQPILKKYCVSCHGPQKSKAKLRLDTFDRLQRGGESGNVVEPGDTIHSLMAKRLRLPLDDDDHMPPDGKPQPSETEIAILQRWIETGAKP